ncbi:MAG TPA: ATP-binding protein [Caulobacterales bacterium]|nr:ATP-binding protein [Caulobacterales bacterium]
MRAACAAQSDDPAEQELRDFSYIVSHDLAAAFRHVAEFTKLLLTDLGPETTESQRVFGEHIRRESTACQAMMEQLLAYSRVQQREMKCARNDVTHLAETAVIQLSADVRASKADIAIEPLGEQVVDADLMTMAFKLALSNAIKFRRPDVPLTISVRGQESGESWGVQISDNGIGVPLERQDKLFSMFYQDFPHGEYAGVGAGLAICRRIVRRHGGDVRFVPTAVGACLEMTVPYPPWSQEAGQGLRQ